MSDEVIRISPDWQKVVDGLATENGQLRARIAILESHIQEEAKRSSASRETPPLRPVPQQGFRSKEEAGEPPAAKG